MAHFHSKFDIRSVESGNKGFAIVVEQFGGDIATRRFVCRRSESGYRNVGKVVSELGRRLRVRDQVLRYMTVRVDEDLRKSRRATERRKATVARRREARGLPPVVEVQDESENAPATEAPVPEVPVAEPAPEPAPEAAPAEPSDDGVGSEESEKAPEVSNEEE